MTSPLVSVCIPASRPSELFEQALASVLRQTHDNLDVVVTDDSNGSVRALALAPGDARVRYEANPRRLGMAGNHSRAADLSRGEHVAFLHDDDVWLPRHVELAVDVLEAQSDVGYVLSAADEVSVDGAFRQRRATAFTRGVQTDPLTDLIDEHFKLTVPSLGVWRRAALDATPRPWPELVTGEVAAFIDPLVQGWKVYYTATPTVRYRVHDDQIGSRRQFDHRDGLVKIWDRYRFVDPHHERLRRHTKARWLLARAGMHLEVGNRQAVRDDVRAAYAEAPAAGAARSLMLLAFSAGPRPAKAVRIWRQLQRGGLVPGRSASGVHRRTG